MMIRTPITDRGLVMYDHLPAAEAVVAAWTQTGPQAAFHRARQQDVRLGMPVLGRALDQLAAEAKEGPR